MKEYKLLSYPDDETLYIDELCRQTKDKGVQMLELTGVKINQQRNRFIMVNNEKSIGYCAETFRYEGSYISEVGSLIVDNQFRNKSYGKMLVRSVTKALMAQNRVPIAFCNEISSGIFISEGYQLAKIRDIPDEAFEECSKCPAKPEEGCCDAVYIYRREV